VLGPEPDSDASASAVPTARLAVRFGSPAAPWPGAFAPSASFSSERRFALDAPVSSVFLWVELEWVRAFLPADVLAAGGSGGGGGGSGGGGGGGGGGGAAVGLGDTLAGAALPFSLTLSFPTRVLVASDARTVEAAGLAPSAALVFRKL